MPERPKTTFALRAINNSIRKTTFQLISGQLQPLSPTFREMRLSRFPGTAMSLSTNYVSVDNPNIPALSVPDANTNFWEYIEVPATDDNLNLGSISKVEVKDLYLPHLSMRKTEGLYARDAQLINRNGVSADLPGSCLFLKGGIRSQAKAINSRIKECGQGQQNFLFDPHNDFSHWIPANTPIDFIHFSIDPGYLTSLLPDDELWADDIRERILRKQWIMGESNSYITMEQKRILNNILFCPLTGRLGEIMLETSVTQIVLLQLWSLFQDSPAPRNSAHSKKERDMAEDIRAFLNNTFLNEHSIDKLSRQFGVNVNKLMSIFKTSFGQSIFDYIGQLRMEHAHQLIQNERYRIIDVARELNYKNANHFSTAFKKHFGIAPTQLRKVRD